MNYNEENKSTKEENIVKEPAANYQAEKKLYTLEDYYALPDDQRVELIDGAFYVMLAPSVTHQTFCMTITNKIFDFIQKKRENVKCYHFR